LATLTTIINLATEELCPTNVAASLVKKNLFFNYSILEFTYSFVRKIGFSEFAFRNGHNKRYARNWQLHGSMHERPGLLIISRYLSNETERSFSNFCSII